MVLKTARILHEITKSRNHEIINQFIDQITILPIYDSILNYGKEKARLRKIGKMVSDFDLFGCTAVEKDLIMVTENVKDFDRISEIHIENWITR